MSRPRRHLRDLISLVSLLGSLACTNPEEQDAGCPSSSGEFGVSGCAVLAGQVVGSSGQPLTDISVSFRALRSCSCTGFNPEVDAQGRFRHTVLLMAPDPAGDTLSVTVRAAATGQQYPPPTPTTFISDSVEALLTFSPVGALPQTTTVEIRLAIP